MNARSSKFILRLVVSKLARNFNSMSSALRGNHVEITANNTREDILSEATISDIYRLSPTVKGFDLIVKDPEFSFKAGQWVDVFIPGEKQVGGFSMCSAPSLLEKSSKIQLAIKCSSWPPSKWFHAHGKVGDKLTVRAGGDFFYDPPTTEKMPNVALIGGGVGINPLLSILLHLSCRYRESPTVDNFPDQLTLLYSSKSNEEILFQDVITNLQTNLRAFDHHYFVTGKGVDDCTNEFQRNRISDTDLLRTVQKSGDNSLYFMCGPPPMIDSFKNRLINLNVPAERIIFEKWW